MKTPIIPRALALVAGVGILAAAAHAVIEAAGGIHEPHAKMVIAATLAVIAGSVAVAHSSWKWAVALSLGLVFGEAYAALSTADRIVAHREAAQVPARAAAEARQSAAARLVRAEIALVSASPMSGFGRTSPGLVGQVRRTSRGLETENSEQSTSGPSQRRVPACSR
ncbi:MAG: hypothetical protein K2Q28_17525 [Hyphomicrobium sp.]|nr:hypothetical protein [Hyphomicrobium sp.]